MKISFLIAASFLFFSSFAQNYRDTVLVKDGFSCKCIFSDSLGDEAKGYDPSAKPASYPGGESEWKKFLRKNLDNIRGKKIEFTVQFMVDKGGDISNITCNTATISQKFEEARRVLKISGKWFPAVENGYCVNSYCRIVFDF